MRPELVGSPLDLNLRELLVAHPPPWKCSTADAGESIVTDHAGVRFELSIHGREPPGAIVKGLVAAVNIGADWLEIQRDRLEEEREDAALVAARLADPPPDQDSQDRQAAVHVAPQLAGGEECPAAS